MPTKTGLLRTFELKHGPANKVNGRPKLRYKYNYFTPDDIFETIVSKLVGKSTRWLDIGCGRNLFPGNIPLSKILSDKCSLLVGLDPDETIHENPYIHEKANLTIEKYWPNKQFNLITMRMVAEHVSDPENLIKHCKRLLQPGGKIIVYTVNQWSPVTIASDLIPFWLHHPIKKILWNTEEKDTFPTHYKMNTRKKLQSLFTGEGLHEERFFYLDDCRTFHRIRLLNWLEIQTCRLTRCLGMSYPENCLLGVYS